MRSAAIRIHESELLQLQRATEANPTTETGGGLYGLWTDAGSPVVLVASTAHPKARRSATFFEQPPDVHMAIERILWLAYGLQCVGIWHSHHTLGLHQLSAGDHERTRRYGRNTGRKKYAEILTYLLAESDRVNAVGMRPHVYHDASVGWLLESDLERLPGISPVRSAMRWEDIPSELRSCLIELAPASKQELACVIEPARARSGPWSLGEQGGDSNRDSLTNAEHNQSDLRGVPASTDRLEAPGESDTASEYVSEPDDMATMVEAIGNAISRAVPAELHGGVALQQSEDGLVVQVTGRNIEILAVIPINPDEPLFMGRRVGNHDDYDQISESRRSSEQDLEDRLVALFTKCLDDSFWRKLFDHVRGGRS